MAKALVPDVLFVLHQELLLLRGCGGATPATTGASAPGREAIRIGAKSFVQLCDPVENDGHGRGLRLLDWRND